MTLAFETGRVDNGGSQILSHKLLRDHGGSQSGSGNIDIIVPYDGQASEVAVTGLTAGAVYRF